ncbi:MAG: hypothetical protein Q4D06_05900 [Coriobacteriia bacterium]|nr:hypothetical protein [Coriobacteriia bacterium]
MDPILESIYSTVIPSAPYLIAAYALIWAVLLVFALMIWRGTKKASDRMALIEEELAERNPGSDAE